MQQRENKVPKENAGISLEEILKESCWSCFHFKDNTCRNLGFYYFNDHVAKKTKCDNWKERE